MPVVTFLSDYGLSDDFVGVCHGVIARIAPQARLIDITHGIPRQDVRTGAVVLRRALEFMPAGVHVAVVDPGVGGERRAVALRCEGGEILVGPDNGLLAPAAERLGGVTDALDIGRSPLRLEPVSRTFHGRDIFAPVAARLATGSPWSEAGDTVDPGMLVTLDLPRPRVAQGAVVAHVLTVDGYGNVALDAVPADLDGSGLTPADPLSVNGRSARYARAFDDVDEGELVLYEDAFGALCVAVNRGSALATLGLHMDDEVVLAPMP